MHGEMSSVNTLTLQDFALMRDISPFHLSREKDCHEMSSFIVYDG